MRQPFSVVRIAILLCAFLAAPAAFADFKVAKLSGGGEVPSPFKKAVQSEGIQVKNDAGQPYVELWLNKALNAEAKDPSFDVIHTGVPEGSFLGVIRFVEQSADFRSQPVKPGYYTMRYALMPTDGNHLGVSQYRDFIVLVPVEADKDPAAKLPFAQAVSLSRKASGTGHPSIWAVFPSSDGEQPTVVQNDLGHHVLQVKVPAKSGAAIPLAFVIEGHGE